jgi:hypothetical protein
MMLRADLFNFLLRIGELAFAAVVAGLTGEYLSSINDVPDNDSNKSRFIYTEVVAAFSMLLALLWLLPFAGAFVHWLIDLILFIAWIVAFALLVQFIGPLDCGSVFYWGDLTNQGICPKWKADVAFAFLSAIFWLASTLLGIWAMNRTGVEPVGGNIGRSRRRWYRSSRV